MALPTLRRGGSPVLVRRADSSTPINGFGRLDPWNDLAVMDRLFDNFFRSPFSLIDRAGTAAAYPTEPQVELYETGDALLAYLYAPGLAPDGFDISAGADSISIRGERKPLLEITDGMTSHTPWGGLATGRGTFNAAYTLPVEIDPDKIQATYKDGVLQLRMTKSEAAKPRQVKVQVGQ
jgi:HSP20 family protein